MNAPVRKKSYADADVADPTIILNHSDSNLVERWEDRKAARSLSSSVPVTRAKRAHTKLLASGKRIDSDFIASARRLYEQGLSLKGIARRMVCSSATISRLRRRYNWASRRGERQANAGQFVEVRVSLPKALLEKIDGHVFTHSSTRSAYLRKIARRDLEL